MILTEIAETMSITRRQAQYWTSTVLLSSSQQANILQQRSEKRKRTIDEMHKIANNRHGRCLSVSYWTH